MTNEAQRTLMVVVAHPDDESFPGGGTIALESARGTRVILVVATGGEAGEVVNPDLRDSVDIADLPAIRQREMACSAAALGIAEVISLGFRDSGMAGTPQNDAPDAFINQDEDEIVARVVELIRRYRPQVLLTFDETGGYGHPDHIKVHHATHRAFDAAGDPAQFPDAGPAWQPNRLFHSIVSFRNFQRLYDAFKERGIPLKLGSDAITDEVIEQFAAREQQISTTVDISSTLERKTASMRCYATQVVSDMFFFTAPEDIRRSMLNTEYFQLALSATDEAPPTSDLFAGISDVG